MNRDAANEIISGSHRVFTNNMPKPPQRGNPTTSKNAEVAALQGKLQENSGRMDKLEDGMKSLSENMNLLAAAVNKLVEGSQPEKKPSKKEG